MTWYKCKHPRWIQVYEPSLEKEYYQKDMGYDPMPDTVTVRVNDLEKGEPGHFILKESKRCIIGDADITGVETSGNKEPQQIQPPK